MTTEAEMVLKALGERRFLWEAIAHETDLRVTEVVHAIREIRRELKSGLT